MMNELRAATAASPISARPSGSVIRRDAHALPSAMPSMRAATTQPAAMLALPNVSERMRIQTSSIASVAAPAQAAAAAATGIE